MNQDLQAFLPQIKKHLGAREIAGIKKIQTLWSGYGGIFRLSLIGSSVPSVIVKCINFQDPQSHPRGWATNLSHQRKLKSYQVEGFWYKNYAHQLPHNTKVPQLLHSEIQGEVHVLVLEDLSPKFPDLKQHCTFAEAKAVVKWLAQFHAHFLQKNATGLWPTGTYWHLATRPDEWKSMRNSLLKTNAIKLNDALENAHFKTFVHGDAKVANFCFAANKAVAAVDFQYVGSGIGVKDLAYFLGSCLTEEECALYENALLDFYFYEMRSALPNWNATEWKALEKEWRQFYPVAWADFNRFLLGWLPTHQKLHSFALTKNEAAFRVLETL